MFVTQEQLFTCLSLGFKPWLCCDLLSEHDQVISALCTYVKRGE